MKINAKDIINQDSMPERMAELLNESATIKVVAGVVGAGTIDLGDTPDAVIAVLAVTSATGAVASKFLLAPTTDYTVSGKVLTCVTDQSANKLIVIYV